MRRNSALPILLALAALPAAAQQTTTPGATWTSKTPAETGLDPAKLDAVRTYLGGRGFVSRYGYQVYTWGDPAARGDIASAAKPFYSHFLFKAIEESRLANVDVKANTIEPCLNNLNAGLGFKDRNITFRHLANQTSCYQVRENPGAAYCYNDWQMALFWDAIFLKVYGATFSNVDADVLRPKLATPIGCQDNPTFMAFGTGDRPGRVGISPRDHARFGLLYLRKGDWNGTRLLSVQNSTTAVTNPLPNSIPQSASQLAEMCPAQRSIGSTSQPDNQTDHKGSYSWLWWVNGVDRNGARLWADAPLNVHAALGHANGKRGMAVMPTQEIVIAWNDTTLDQRPSSPHPLNEVFKLLVQAVTTSPPANQPPTITSASAAPSSGPAPLAVSFTAAAADPEGQALTYTWDFEGDGTTDAAGPAASHTYANPGSYDALLRVSDGTNSVTRQVPVTATSVGAGLITNIQAASGRAYDTGLLDVGRTPYIDRTFTFSAVAPSYTGLEYIRTANDDKASTGSTFLSFDVAQDVTVYVAYDDRFSARPSWMTEYTDTGDDIVSGAGTFRLWARDYASGTVTLGANTDTGTTSNSMYTAVARPRTGPPADADGDGMTDAQEATAGFDRLDPDQDRNGTLDGQDDWDLDGTLNRNDLTPGSVPSPAAPSGSSSGGGCGLLGLEALLLFLWSRKRLRLILLVSLAGTLAAAAPRAPLPGHIVVDPATPRWLARSGGGPFFLCGPGDPEDFLYRGSRNADGTRSGDQMALINKVKGTGANSIYLQAVRSHGGDGPADHNPFVNSDPAQGLDADILGQWEGWFTEMDSAGIVVYFFLYDDSARVWNTGDSVGAAERAFLQGIVNRFEHHRNLIWCVAEEYQEVYSAARARAIAAEIRAADDSDHVIAVHKLSGLTFSEFADDPNIDQFAIQHNVATAGELHAGMLAAWNNAAGKYSLNMSEAAGHGTGAAARKKNWACALGGAYVMVLGMDIASTTAADLEDCGRLVSFMESTDFNRMAPHDELKHGGTEYVLALPGDSYIAYASALAGNIGLRGMAAGTYSFRWFDCATGASVTQAGVNVAAGDQAWTRPGGIGSELAVWVKKTGGASNVAPTATNQSVTVPHNTATSVPLSTSDPDGPGPYAFTIVQPPARGTLSGSGATRTYTPNAGTSGPDTFTWKVNDGLADSNVATVSLAVQAAGNNAPVARDQSFTTGAGTAVAMSLSYTDPDGPGPYAVAIVRAPANGTLSGANNDRTYTPNAGFTGSDSFTWKVSDGLADSNVATVTIAVSGGGGMGLITNVGAQSGLAYAVDTLDVGKLQYVDRAFTFSSVPGAYVGLEYIRTANDDKGSTGSAFLSFDAPQPVRVYVGYDDRFAALPTWMASYTDTSSNIASGAGTFRLWSMDHPAGTVVLGGNTSDGVAQNSMYTVVVGPQAGAPADADGDGMTDAFEAAHGFNPADPDQDANVRIDGDDDWDLDGILNRNDPSPGSAPGLSLAGGSSSGGGCGATGLEALALLLFARRRRSGILRPSWRGISPSARPSSAPSPGGRAGAASSRG